MTDLEILNALTEMDKTVVVRYAENMMRMYRTAKELYMTHSGIHYHLISIKAKTGLDPKNFYDLVYLVRLIQKEREANG